MTPEGKVEKYLVKQVEARGGFVRKVKWIGRRAAPDRYVSIPGYPGWTGFIELKAYGKTARAEQAREHKRMREAGTNVLVLDCEAKIDIFLDRVEHGQVVNKDIQMAIKEWRTK